MRAVGGGLEESLVAVEEIVDGAEDEECAEPAGNREEGVHHIRRSLARTFNSWEGKLQHHGCVAQRQDEHVAVRELRISLPVEHRRVPCELIGGEVVRHEVVPVSPNLAIERGVVDAEFTGVGILRK